MEQQVSRARTRKTKTRQKQADKAAAGRSALRENPVLGLSLAGLVWLYAVLLLGWEGFFAKSTDPAFLLPLAGRSVFALVGLLAGGLFLEIVRPGLLRQNARTALMVLIAVVALSPAKAILYAFVQTGLMPVDTVQFLLPLAIAPLLATILVDGAVGVAVGVWTSLMMSLLVDNSLPLFLAGIVATMVTARTAHRVRTRSKVIRTGLVIGLSQIICVFGLTALHWDNPDLKLVVHQAGACLLSGFFSALVVLLILPIFEALFGITTDIALLELSDLGHPLLQRLAIEAPGTYHHSLVVANLAHAAADEIGANGLLARVGAYFHDAGKLTKPEFFSENIQYRTNPHDNLAPSMSTLVISAHVKEGLSLAMVHKLPEVVMKAIREHHGTSLMSYFHHKAQEQIREEPDASPGPQGNGKPGVDEADFRYAGPRPTTPETAILCLADAVEAASRSAAKTTPGHLKNLVNDIVNARLIDGQLDASGLTLAQLDAVKRSFIFTLTSMLHGRIPYPHNENRDNQQTRPPSTERSQAKEPRAQPDAAGRKHGPAD